MALAFSPPQQVYSGQGQYVAMVQTQVTIDASYTSGGITLTPAQLGLTSRVFFGQVGVRTATATGPSNGVLDCTNPQFPKLKLQNAGATAELGAGAASGAVLDITVHGA